MPDDNVVKIEAVLDLLQDATSLDVVREFLRKKGLFHTAGSWKDLRERRLKPYLDNFDISLEELIALLTSAEECGDQHIFLFQCVPAEVPELIDRERVKATLRAAGLERLLEQPDIERKPRTPTIVEVRWGVAKVDVGITIKEAEVRSKRVLVREKPRGNLFVRIYREDEVRAINVAKLHSDGLLEVRIQSRDNTTKYDGDVFRFMRQLNAFLPIQKFREVSLSTAKANMWRRRVELVDLIRYTNASVVDEEGNKVQAHTGNSAGNLVDGVAGRTVDYMLNEDANSYCSDSNLWFKESDHLSSSIHVLLNGSSNEFAIPRKCSAEDYEYVLRQIRNFNR